MVNPGSPGIQVQGQWTYHNLDSLPDEIKRYELWDGELIIMPAPSIRHQMLVKRLLKRFLAYDPDEIRGEFLFAPADVVLAPNWVVQPDILFISAERRSLIQEQRIMGGPDLVVEVLSPRTTWEDRVQKRRAYAAAEVREYWLLDPSAEIITVLVLQEGDYAELGAFGSSDVIHSQVLEGFTLNVSVLFDHLDLG